MSLEHDWNDALGRIKFINLKNERKIWTVGNQNKNIDVHLYAINYLKENQNRGDVSTVHEEMVEVVNNEFGRGNTIEGNRSLIMSKHLGLIKEYQPIETSHAYEKLISLNNSNKKEKIISNQAEKFYIKSGIGSNVNRHAENNRTANIEFDIYPIFLLYDLIKKLTERGFPSGNISKFEMDYFIIGSHDHNDVDVCLQNIIDYRLSHTRGYMQNEVEAYLKNSLTQEQDKYTTPDNRFFPFINLVKFFDTSSGKIVLLQEHQDEAFERLTKFKSLKDSGNLINAYQENNTDYLKLLYSDLDLFEFHNSI